MINPATGETIGEIPATPLEETDEIMRRARKAFTNWQTQPLATRLHVLRRLRHYLIDHLDEAIALIAEDTGKPKVEAITADILTVVDMIRYLEKNATKSLRTRKVKTPLTLIGKKSYVTYQPRGVVLVISPWNYPFQLAMIPVLNALAAGNSVILKPSEVTPRVGEWMAHLFRACRFPDDVVQVAHGGGALGAELVAAGPDYIFFTGSVATGKRIQQEAAKRLIPTTLELGGKDPMIVFRDAPIERAVQGAIWGAFTHSGQVCMSVERLYVERPLYVDFLHALKAELDRLRQADDADSDLGAMTSPSQRHIVHTHIRDAISKGATVAWGSEPEQWPERRGLQLPPTVLTDVTEEMDIAHEETFGPVLSVLPFDDEAEAIQLANDSSFGLNASVWSRDLSKAKRVAAALVSGNVVINDVIVSVANPYLPFGGSKESGIGRYHADVGLKAFCHEKSLLVDPGKKKTEVNWFPYRGKLPLFRTLVASLYGKKRSPLRFVSSYLQLLKRANKR